MRCNRFSWSCKQKAKKKQMRVCSQRDFIPYDFPSHTSSSVSLFLQTPWIYTNSTGWIWESEFTDLWRKWCIVVIKKVLTPAFLCERHFFAKSTTTIEIKKIFYSNGKKINDVFVFHFFVYRDENIHSLKKLSFFFLNWKYWNTKKNRTNFFEQNVLLWLRIWNTIKIVFKSFQWPKCGRWSLI